MKFEVGDLVVPISKSKGCSLDIESGWNHAQKRQQPYLHIARIYQGSFFDSKTGKRVDVYALNEDADKSGGNHYLLQDIIPYYSSNRRAVRVLKQD